MPINPHVGEGPVATAWYDQFAAELKQESHETLETCLHARGLCSSTLTQGALEVMDDALQSGAYAMAKVLEAKGRIRESGDVVDNGLLAALMRKILLAAETAVIGEGHMEQAELVIDDIAEVEMTPAELAVVKQVLGR